MSLHDDKKINEAIQELGGKRDFEVFRAKVITVNDDDTVDVDDDGTKYNDVSLRAVNDGGKGIVLVPKVDSFVMVAKVKKGAQYSVINCSEVDKVKIDCEEIVFNQGDNYGMVKVKELTEQLNAVEKKLNDLLSTLKTITIPLAPSGTYPFAPLFASTLPLTTTQQSDIENKKIKH
jgi:hypothetical protein